jgi:hypothetical protein
MKVRALIWPRRTKGAYNICEIASRIQSSVVFTIATQQERAPQCPTKPSSEVLLGYFVLLMLEHDHVLPTGYCADCAPTFYLGQYGKCPLRNASSD